MKKKLTRKYMTIFAISVVSIVLIWVLLSYIFIFGRKDAKVNEPQYLVNRFEQYVDFEKNVSISEQGKRIIKDNQLWIQIIDNSGNVLLSYNTNENVPEKYDVFEITKDTMNSNVVQGQTLFVSRFVEHNDQGVVIGCDSSKVSKYNIKITGGIKTAIIKSLIVLVIVFVVVGALAGMFYSWGIFGPISNMIENINSLEKDKELVRVAENSIYFPVYESILKLKFRLNEAKNERKKVDKQRENWISNISHDMKTPLTTIKGYAEIMEDQSYNVSSEEQKRYSEIIIRNVKVIEGLVKDLNLSKLLNEGKVTMHKERMNVCQLLKECCDDVCRSYQDKIQMDFENKIIFINADKNYMRRVFVNIICNAFIHNNRDVQLCVDCYERDGVIIEISDNGKGMCKEELENIFSRYYRGKASTQVDGSGLGMAISYEIIKAHNGKIDVKSEVNRGTKFVIYLDSGAI